MPPTVHIRLAQPQDVPEIHRLAAATWWATYGGFIAKDQLDFMFGEIYRPEALLRQINEEGQTFLLLLVDDEPAGFASFSLKNRGGQGYKLNKLYVKPGNQQKGLGRALLTAVEEQVCQRRGQVLDLNVNRHNPAKSFYERCGFSVLHEEDIPIGPYWMNDYVMRKELPC
jgi:ribosomal protein S18 acetylase RimI-like enzyme